MKEWVHPRHTSKGGPGDPLLECAPASPTPTLAFRCSQLTSKQYKKVLELIEDFEEANARDHRTAVSVRDTNCMGCNKPGRCEVVHHFNENGHLCGAEVTRWPKGWEQLPCGGYPLAERLGGVALRRCRRDSSVLPGVPKVMSFWGRSNC